MQEQYENQEEGQIDLLEIIHVMLRKWWLIVLCGIIGAGALGVYTKFFVTPQYSASSTILYFYQVRRMYLGAESVCL